MTHDIQPDSLPDNVALVTVSVTKATLDTVDTDTCLFYPFRMQGYRTSNNRTIIRGYYQQLALIKKNVNL